MSAYGTKRTFQSTQVMSAFGGEADIGWTMPNVRFGPNCDIVPTSIALAVLMPGRTVSVAPRFCYFINLGSRFGGMIRERNCGGRAFRCIDAFGAVVDECASSAANVERLEMHQ